MPRRVRVILALHLMPGRLQGSIALGGGDELVAPPQVFEGLVHHADSVSEQTLTNRKFFSQDDSPFQRDLFAVRHPSS
jgi:hypothetical protein